MSSQNVGPGGSERVSRQARARRSILDDMTHARGRRCLLDDTMLEVGILGRMTWPMLEVGWPGVGIAGWMT